MKFMPLASITAYTPCKVQEIRMDIEVFRKGCYEGVGMK